VDVVDRRRDDPAAGEWCSPALARVLQSGATVACVLNRTGRARLAICRQCGTVARSELTGQAMLIRRGGEAGQELATPDGADVRPLVCAGCGATAFRRARIGTGGVRDELARMARRPVAEVVAGGPDPAPGTELFVGTEALLHRAPPVDVVAFLDLDQELLAGRYRAAEEAMALLVRAARVLGPRRAGGRLLVQTRLPHHPVVQAALHADPSRMVEGELAQRRAAGWPPAVALAVVSGAAGGTYVAALRAVVDVPGTAAVAVAGPVEGRWLVTAPDHATLLGALHATPRPPGRLRVAVDPLRV
jgi:primosomal protein N' (replication factor Y)